MQTSCFIVFCNVFEKCLQNTKFCMQTYFCNLLTNMWHFAKKSKSHCENGYKHTSAFINNILRKNTYNKKIIAKSTLHAVLQEFSLCSFHLQNFRALECYDQYFGQNIFRLFPLGSYSGMKV